ncbi:35731_t:CDS:2, partial [Racocetra persica]
KMDLPTVLLQVEEACADLQVPSTRHAGEQVIMSFKQMSGNLDARQYILAYTIPCCTILHGVIGERIRDSRLRFVFEGIFVEFKELVVELFLAIYVQKQILHAISVMIKRSLDDFHEIKKRSILIQIQELVTMDGYNRQVGVALANELVDEFSTTKASNVGLPWDFHKKTKEFFE